MTMIFFHRWLDKYKKSKLQYIKFQIKFDNFSEFQNVISHRPHPTPPYSRTSLWRIAYENRFVTHPLIDLLSYTAQKMKFSITDFSSKCDQILRIWWHLLKKSVMENFIFCALYKLVTAPTTLIKKQIEKV